MNYRDYQTPIPQAQREELNKKVIYLIDSDRAEVSGITQEDIFNAYTGVGGLHGLNREDFDNYHEYSEEKRSLRTGSFSPRPSSVRWLWPACGLRNTILWPT